ncbi:MAG: replication initiation protein [Chloroflexi bacterium]|nr:replication initiation protein [Chloroflexota bacterium]
MNRSTATPPLQNIPLPLDYAPAPVRMAGLADMHPFPLVSAGKRPGEPFRSKRVEAREAWQYPEVEYARTPTSYPALVVDVDGQDALNRVRGAMLAGEIREPSWTAHRASSGGVHAVWTLTTPVHRYPHARRAPLDLLARVSEFYTEALHGDHGYAGVLAHNPEAPAFDAVYGSGWSLAELADTIPAGWRRPRRQHVVSPLGRNVALFRELCRYAGRGLHTDRGPSLWQIEGEAERLNMEFEAPLDYSEIRHVLKHVFTYRDRWLAQGHQPSFLARQSARGKRSGETRRRGSITEAAPWRDEGISRATWYRRRVRHEPIPIVRSSGSLPGVGSVQPALPAGPPPQGAEPDRQPARESAPGVLRKDGLRPVAAGPGPQGAEPARSDGCSSSLSLGGAGCRPKAARAAPYAGEPALSSDGRWLVYPSGVMLDARDTRTPAERRREDALQAESARCADVTVDDVLAWYRRNCPDWNVTVDALSELDPAETLAWLCLANREAA